MFFVMQVSRRTPVTLWAEKKDSSCVKQNEMKNKRQLQHWQGQKVPKFIEIIQKAALNFSSYEIMALSFDLWPRAAAAGVCGSLLAIILWFCAFEEKGMPVLPVVIQTVTVTSSQVQIMLSQEFSCSNQPRGSNPVPG